jgi:GT2 family glycosyltransferase
MGTAKPVLSICVLTYGDYPRLARRCIESIRRNCARPLYRLIVGANEVGHATRAYLERLGDEGAIDRLCVNEQNINKCPMMRRMFKGIDTEFIWWFDDDSYIKHPEALAWHLKLARRSPPTTVMWGREAECVAPFHFINVEDMVSFVRRAKWYAGLTPPSWQPGGKGEFNFRGRGTGDGRWRFVAGGCWWIRTAAVRALDWPDRRLIKLGDDVLLGEAIRQQGWRLGNTGGAGVEINTRPRRGRDGKVRLEISRKTVGTASIER